jgi:hypothetical protein
MQKWQIIAGAFGILLVGLIAIDMSKKLGAPQRVTEYQQGTYLGKPDTPLSEETLELLRQRSRSGAAAW